jgi:hypothetical protein
MSGFDKFAWIDAVRDSTELTPAVKYVLQSAALGYVLHEDRAKALGREAGQLYARQATIAEACRVSIRLVKTAYADARRLGFFVLTEARQRGRGHASPDTYRLIIPPEVGANAAPISGEIGARNVEIGARNVEIGARADALTCDNDTITGGSTGGETGEKPVPVIFDDEPQPSRLPARRTGSANALARFDRLNETARSQPGYLIAQAFSASLSVPIESEHLADVGVQIDKCLRSSIPPPAIAAGLKAWNVSGAWSPTNIPSFVRMAANRTSDVGKPTAKAAAYQDLADQLIAEIENPT